MITQRDIRNLKPEKDRPYKKGCGNGLFIWIQKSFIGKDGKEYGGNKYFKGSYKGSDVQIGIFGTGYGELSLKDAQEEWAKQRPMRDAARKSRSLVYPVPFNQKEAYFKKIKEIERELKGSPSPAMPVVAFPNASASSAMGSPPFRWRKCRTAPPGSSGISAAPPKTTTASAGSTSCGNTPRSTSASARIWWSPNDLSPCKPAGGNHWFRPQARAGRSSTRGT